MHEETEREGEGGSPTRHASLAFRNDIGEVVHGEDGDKGKAGKA